MFRIGIIGSENSHAMAFSEIFNTTDRYPDLRVVGIYGEDRSASEAVCKKCGLDFLAESPRDFEGRVDAMMITSRDGSLHAGYARPFIEQGMPLFIDKPFTSDAREAKSLLALAEKTGSPLMGGSSVKFTPDVLALKHAADEAKKRGTLAGGHVYTPVKLKNPYGDFYFYSAHLIESAMTIFGYDALGVKAVVSERGVYAMLDYGAYWTQLSYLEEQYQYGGCVLSDQPFFSPIDISACYDAEVRHFAEMLRSGNTPQPAAELLLPVAALNAIERATVSGGWEKIEA